jgi:acyl-CoA synthetase (AMP-forming)/AMP-acid ligase II
MTGLRPHQEFSGSVDIPFANVSALFAARRDENADRTFLISPGTTEESFTYAEFDRQFRRVMAYVADLGLVKGDRFNLVLANSPEFLLFYFAGLTLGTTVVPINPDLSADEMRYIIDDSQSKAVFYHRSVAAKVEEAQGKVAGSPMFRCVDEVRQWAAGDTPSPSGRDPELPSIGQTDEAIIIYTSGTSGNPKGVVLSHINLLADAKAISEWFQFTRDTRTLCILPLFHNNGQITTCLAPLYAGGATIIVKGKASLMAFWGLVQQYSATFTSVMPSILSVLLNTPIERADKTLAAILCGGQVLARQVQDDFENRFGVPVFEGYGLTETTSFSCINSYPKETRKQGSIGRALMVNDMAILDESGNDLGPNREGEICIRGRNVACEYLGLPERNARQFANGWFHSGDFGTRDEDGFYYFHGRKDFLIIKGGENIYPAELENVIFKHPAVAECAVIGIPDKLLGEDLCAFVKRREGMEVSADEIKAFCRGKIAGYKQARKIVIIDDLPDLPEIPKGPTKKVLYRKLQEYYAFHLAGQPAGRSR